MKVRLALILSMIVVTAVVRLTMSGIPNVSPVTALALFSGAYLVDRKIALLVPVIAMLLGDLVLGLHNTMFFVYGAFILIAGMGIWLSSRLCGHLLIAASLVASSLFFIVTNFGVWAVSGFYPMTFEGLLMSYTAAIPFFQMSLMGDLFFTGVIFGAFFAMEQFFPSLRSASIKAA